MSFSGGSLPFYSRIPRLTFASGVLLFAFLGLAFAFRETLSFWTAFAALSAPCTGFFVATILNHRERTRIFEDFNRRTWDWRERWQGEQAADSWSPLAIETYTHLSAEKFRAYREGLVSEDVWHTWREEMAFYFSKDAFIERWHLEESAPVYGFHPSFVTPDFPLNLDAVISRKIANQDVA